MTEGLIDLHVHSTFSDGTKTPEELVEMAHQKGIKILGITDHDTVEGVKKYLESANRNNAVYVVPGIEIDTTLLGQEVHILGYFHQDNLPAIEQRVAKLKLYRMMEMVQTLRLLNEHGVKAKASDIKKTYGGLSMNALAKYLVDKGYASDRTEAFQKYLGASGCAYVKKYVWNFNETVTHIHECGGVAIIAHPIQSANIDELDNFVESLVALGIEGIEVYHPDQDAPYSQKCEQLVKKYKLFSTGGSDYHGDYKPTVNLGRIHGNKIPAVDFLNKRFDHNILAGKGCFILGADAHINVTVACL